MDFGQSMPTQTPRIVLFGASSMAKDYLTERMTQEHIIAILDNNPKIQGTSLFSIPILAPKEISSLTFDKVIIASQYAQEIHSQLTGELKIPADKIALAPKNGYTPLFYHQPTRALAKASLAMLNQMMVKHDINMFLDFGTLLGFTRDQDIIPWDSDMDVSILESEMPKLLKVLPNLLSIQAKEVAVELSYTVHSNLIKLDFSPPSHMDLFPFFLDIFIRTFDQDGFCYCSTPAPIIWKSPRVHFDSHEYLLIDNETYCVPYKKEDYLQLVYGDWKKPNKLFTLLDWKNLE